MTSKMGKTRIRPLNRYQEPINDEGIYCPLCSSRFHPSEYLGTVFLNPKLNWFANMICHYRHNHIDYYEHSVGYYFSRGQYEEFKHKVNERAKRQILRKCGYYMRCQGLKARDLKELQGTTEKTLEVASEVLEGVARSRTPARKALRIIIPRDRAQTCLEDFV